jgi:CspA family cold shock protein
MIMGTSGMMATGTVKSFNPSKGYGFIRTESGGKDVFVHASEVQKAGLASLRKGQKIRFEIFDNQGKAAAKNLRPDTSTEELSSDKSLSVQNELAQDERYAMSPRKIEQIVRKRTFVTRSALEVALTEAVRTSDPECGALVGIVVERVAPGSPGGANWIVKGVKYGKADRARCGAVISRCVEEGQREFEVSD